MTGGVQIRCLVRLGGRLARLLDICVGGPIILVEIRLSLVVILGSALF